MGASAVLKTIPYEPARGAGASPNFDLVRLVADGALLAGDPPALPARLRAPLPELGAPSVVRRIRLGESMGHGGIRFTINGATYPNVSRIAAAAGSVQAWDIINESDMDHPFHLHAPPDCKGPPRT